MITEQPLKSDLLRGDWFIVCCFDGYEPRLAQIVIDTISEQEELTITLLWNHAADKAREEMNLN